MNWNRNLTDFSLGVAGNEKDVITLPQSKLRCPRGWRANFLPTDEWPCRSRLPSRLRWRGAREDFGGAGANRGRLRFEAGICSQKDQWPEKLFWNGRRKLTNQLCSCQSN